MASSNKKPSKRSYLNVPEEEHHDGDDSVDDVPDPLSNGGSTNNGSTRDDQCDNGDHVLEQNGHGGHSALTVEVSLDDAIGMFRFKLVPFMFVILTKLFADRLGMGLFQYRILVAAGLCFAADAMEVLLLSFLSIVLQDEWRLTDDETAFITSILFLGALVRSD